MGDIHKKQRRQIMELIAERSILKQQLNEYHRKVLRYDEMESANKIMADKIKQVMEDISQKVSEASVAKSELSSMKRNLDVAYRDIAGFKENESQYRKALERAEKELTSLKLKLNDDSLEKTRERLRKRGEELAVAIRQLTIKDLELDTLKRKVSYLESNAKLDQKAV